MYLRFLGYLHFLGYHNMHSDVSATIKTCAQTTSNTCAQTAIKTCAQSVCYLLADKNLLSASWFFLSSFFLTWLARQVCQEGSHGLTVIVSSTAARAGDEAGDGGGQASLIGDADRVHVLGGVLEREWKVAERVERRRSVVEGRGGKGRRTAMDGGPKRAWGVGGDVGGGRQSHGARMEREDRERRPERQPEGAQGWRRRAAERLSDREREWDKVVLDTRNVSVRGARPGAGGAETETGAWGGGRKEGGVDVLGGWAGAVVDGQWVLLKGGSGVIGDLCCQLNAPPASMSLQNDAENAFTEVEWVEESGEREVKDVEWERVGAEDGVAEGGETGGEVACVGVCGGQWRFETCRIVAGAKLDAMRCSYASEVTVWGCDVGGMSSQSCASSAVTALHRSRVVVERSVILPTEYAAIRALGRCRLALNHSRFDARTLYTLDIEPDAHVVLRNVYMHRAPELAVRQDKHCYEDTLPLYRPSLFCDWCPRWVGDLMRLDVELAGEEKEQATRAAVATAKTNGGASTHGALISNLDFDNVGGQGKVGELVEAPILIPLFLDNDVRSDGTRREKEGTGKGGTGGDGDELLTLAGERQGGQDSEVDVRSDTMHDCWLYYDKSLDGDTFVNGRQQPLGPTSAGPRVGSVMTSLIPFRQIFDAQTHAQHGPDARACARFCMPVPEQSGPRGFSVTGCVSRVCFLLSRCMLAHAGAP